MNIIKTKTSVCRKFSLTPDDIQCSKFRAGLTPFVNWDTVNQMFYAALRSGCDEDEAIQAIFDFNEFFVGTKFPLSKKEFKARREKRSSVLKNKPVEEVKENPSGVDAYLARYQSKKYREENQAVFDEIIREVKKRLSI